MAVTDSRTAPHAVDKTCDAFFDLAAKRRSVRHFQERAVPPDVIRRMVETAMHAPTACNRQLWHFVVVTDPDVKDAMSRLGDSYSQSYLYDAPAIIAVFYDASMESRNPCHTAYVSAGMAIYALLLAAEAQNLGAIFLGGIMDPRGIAAAVGAPRHLRNLGLVCIGYPDDTPPAPSSRAIDDVISHNMCREGLKPLSIPDVRPSQWTLEQLADFRDKILWYKGIAFDGKTVHVNPDPRFSTKLQHITHRLAMLIQKHKNATVLDVMPFNGDLMIQTLMACPGQIHSLYGFELTQDVTRYIDIRLRTLFDNPPVQWAVNNDPERISIPLPDNSVDVISCYQRLGQFDNPRPLLGELRRVLRPGGTLLTIDSNFWYPHIYWYKRAMKKNYALGRNWNFGPEMKFRPDILRGHFRQTGFKIRNMTSLNPLTSKLPQLAAKYAAKFGRYDVEERLRRKASRASVKSGWTRYVSEILIHELEKV